MTMPNESNLPEVATVLSRTSAGGVLALVTPSGVLYAQGGLATAASFGIAATGAATVQSLNGSGAAPVVAAGAGAGTGATVSAQKGHDLGGSFVLTTAGVPAAGTLATITFGTPLATAPVSVIVTCWDNTGAAGVAVGYSATASVITILGPATTTAHALLVSYAVVAS